MAQKEFDLSKMEVRAVYNLLSSAIIPRPIAWVSSISADGVVNLAPFSYFSGVTSSPPTLCFSVANRRDGSRKDTVLNIEETGQFVVNMVPEEMGALMVDTAATVPREVDEARQFGIALAPSTVVSAPCVREADVSFECELDRIVTVGDGSPGANLILGRIRMMHVNEDILESETIIDPVKSRILGRLYGTKYCRIQSVIEISPR